MKKLIFFCLFFIVKIQAQTNHKKDFVLGVYFPPDIVNKSCEIKDFKNPSTLLKQDMDNLNGVSDCGFNLIVNAMGDQLTNEKERNYYLELIKNNGNLRVMLSDFNYVQKNINPKNLNIDKGSKEFLTSFPKKYNNLYPVSLLDKEPLYKYVYAFDLKDEPSPNDMDNLGKWATYCRKNFSDRPTFTNLIPISFFDYNNDSKTFRHPKSIIELYSKYLNAYKLADAKSPIVCFDIYPFYQSSEGIDFRTNYFQNLYLVKKLFPNRSLWSVVHSVYGDGYINENEAMLRFMAFCPIAYGAKGLLDYIYQVPSWNYVSIEKNKNNSRGLCSALADDSKKYIEMQNINKYIKDIVAPVIMNSKYIATLHKNNTKLNINTLSDTSFPYSYPFNDVELVKNYRGVLKDISDNDFMCGIFTLNNPQKLGITKAKNSNSTEYYIWMVNKNTNTTKRNISIILNGSYTNTTISPSVINYCLTQKTTYDNPEEISYNPLKNETIVTIDSFVPGEGRILKVVN